MKRKLVLATHALRKRARAFKSRAILFLLIICGNAWALDQFQGVQCGADILKSLIGKRSSNERVVAVEERHKDLRLKNLGGTEISDRLFLESWQICGHEYELLVNTKTGLIRDVLQFPSHSQASPMFIGACQADGKDIPGVVAVLDNSAGHNPKDEKLAKTMLKATGAWKIDQAKEKFAQQPTANLGCPLEGIVTQDGGR